MDVFTSKILWVSVGIGFSSFFAYYLYKSKKPKLIYEKTSFNEAILNRMKKIHERFYSTIWMMNPHLHTVLSEMVRTLQGDKIEYDREVLKLEDGSTLSLDYPKGNSKFKDETPTVFLYPGVTGHSQVSYIKQMALDLVANGYRVVCLNQRGINCELTVSFSESNIQTPQFSCASYIGDIEHIINHLKKKYPSSDLYGISYSMGANLLLKHLGKNKNTQLKAAISISNPLDFVKGAALFQNWTQKKLYSEHLCKGALTMIK